MGQAPAMRARRPSSCTRELRPLAFGRRAPLPGSVRPTFCNRPDSSPSRHGRLRARWTFLPGFVTVRATRSSSSSRRETASRHLAFASAAGLDAQDSSVRAQGLGPQVLRAVLQRLEPEIFRLPEVVFEVPQAAVRRPALLRACPARVRSSVATLRDGFLRTSLSGRPVPSLRSCTGMPAKARGSGLRSPCTRGRLGLPLYPAQLSFELRLQLAALLQLGVGPLQPPAGRDAPPPKTPSPAASSSARRHAAAPPATIESTAPWRRMLWRPSPISPATDRTSASLAREPLILYSVSPAREMRREIETSL